jgi:hypothetical protein
MKTFAHRTLSALAIFALATVASAQTPTRYMGSVTSIASGQIVLKTAQGDEHKIAVAATADVKRIEPGQTNLATAVAMPLADLAVGDRILVWIDPASPADNPGALRIVAIKAADLAQKRQQEAADWQINGVGGLVKTTDPATGLIVVTSGAGATAKTVTVHTDKATTLKRYAAASISYESAQPGPFEAIHPGDQLMARGQKNADGTDLLAKEVVSGSFRNVSGLIASLDPDHQSFTIKDLATKKTLTVTVPADAQMKQVPANVAAMLAARLKGTSAPAAAPAQQGAAAPPAGAPPQGGGNPAWQGRGQGGAPGGQRGGAASNDPQQMLTRLPAIHFADLTKGEAVMLVSSPGDSQVTAITLLAGVEALLEAPASQNLLANWSMGGGEGGGEGAQ